MAGREQQVYVVRHGATEWSLSGPHTGVRRGVDGEGIRIISARRASRKEREVYAASRG
jgi:uncharacterized DUF497 family protein